MLVHPTAQQFILHCFVLQANYADFFEDFVSAVTPLADRFAKVCEHCFFFFDVILASLKLLVQLLSRKKFLILLYLEWLQVGRESLFLSGPR